MDSARPRAAQDLQAGDPSHQQGRGRRLLCFLALTHLSIAASFALIPKLGSHLGKLPMSIALPLRLYGSVTGGTAGYGFFSPDIAPEVRARFEVVDAAGQRRPVSLTGANREADLRVGNLVNWQWDLRHLEESLGTNRALAASCAGKIFANNPDARRVDVHVEYYDLPRMDRFRAGETPRWVSYYKTSFQRPPAPAAP